MQPSTPLSTRQKNCNTCVQSKRRCDRQTPICSRCAERDVPCTYGKPKKRKLDAPSTFTEIVSPPSPSAIWFDPGLTLDMGYLENPILESQSESTYHAATSDMFSHGLISNNISMGVFDSSESANTSYPSSTHVGALIPEECDQPYLRSGSPIDDEILRSWEKMGIFCGDVQPWHLHDSQTRLHFAVDRVKGFTTHMANHNATPFLHHNLYQDSMPSCILSCFSTSVLYTNRTPANTPMVLRTLHSNVTALVDSESDQSLAIAPLHRLARTQSLFIYEIIRLFDGDIALRAQGEKHLSLLQTWLSELCCLRNNLRDTIQGGDNPSPTWKEWIFDESVRRTVVMAYSVIGLYDLMKDPGEKLGNPGPWAIIHRWTLGGSLWKAKTEPDFDRLWARNQHFVIANFSFDKFIAQGRGEEIDEFAEMLLGVYMGVDETRKFMTERAGPKSAKAKQPS